MAKKPKVTAEAAPPTPPAAPKSSGLATRKKVPQAAPSQRKQTFAKPGRPEHVAVHIFSRLEMPDMDIQRLQKEMPSMTLDKVPWLSITMTTVTGHRRKTLLTPPALVHFMADRPTLVARNEHRFAVWFQNIHWDKEAINAEDQCAGDFVALPITDKRGRTGVVRVHPFPFTSVPHTERVRSEDKINAAFSRVEVDLNDGSVTPLSISHVANAAGHEDGFALALGALTRAEKITVGEAVAGGFSVFKVTKNEAENTLDVWLRIPGDPETWNAALEKSPRS